MERVTIRGMDAFAYREVFEILEWKNGHVYKTRRTGQFIKTENADKLDRNKYTVSALSTNLSRLDEFEIPIFQV